MVNKQLFCTFLAAVIFCTGLLAQEDAFQQITVPVFQNNQEIAYPFVGGLNAPQFSSADLNNDGGDDLVIFDRAGDVILTFINNFTGGVNAFVYAPEYARTFPPFEDFMLLRDYNKDGVPDVFCAPFGNVAAQEVRVFQGYYKDNVLHFKPFYFTYPASCANCNPLYIYYPDQIPGVYNNFPVAPSDYPAIDDIDGDGDLDIVAFSAGNSTYLSYLKNMSVEKGFGSDSLQFELADRCWGKIYENGLEACRAKLSPDPNQCAIPFTDGELEDRNAAHPGASILTLDRDKDGDKDLILGNIAFNCLNYLQNGGTPQNAWMVAQDTTFPSEDEVVELLSFPAAYYIDINNDNKKDLIVAPNSPTINEDRANVWWYNEVIENDSVKYQLQTKKLFTSEMIDMGTITHPAFADVNGDGLLDMVVGNYGYYTAAIPGSQGAIYTNTRLYLYTNTGTPSVPEFTLTNTDWMDLSAFGPNEYDLAPAFGDLDGDGDTDMVVGNNNGYLYTYFNLAGPGAPLDLQRDFNALWLQMDVGQSSTPVIYDLDGDGLNDILMGEKSGNINFFKNIGSVNNPNFNPDESILPNLSSLGAINTQIVPNGIGYSAPQIISVNNQLLLITGAQDGHFEAYRITGVTSTAYPEVDLSWGNVDVGKRSSPAIADINEDGILEMVAGNVRGGLTLFKTVDSPFTPPSVTHQAHEKVRFQISPNPASAFTELLISGQTGVNYQWYLHDLLGCELQSGNTTDKLVLIPTHHLPSGIYVISVSNGNGKMAKKLIIHH